MALVDHHFPFEARETVCGDHDTLGRGNLQEIPLGDAHPDFPECEEVRDTVARAVEGDQTIGRHFADLFGNADVAASG